MQKKVLASVLAFVVGGMLSANALAQAKPEVLVKQRQAAMTLQGKYFGPLGGMAAGRVPYDAAVVARNAGYLEALSKMAWDGFNPSTAGEKSATLPEAFADAGKFKQAADSFQLEVGKLVGVAKGGSEGDVKTAIAAVGKSCGSCHDGFRAKP